MSFQYGLILRRERSVSASAIYNSLPGKKVVLGMHHGRERSCSRVRKKRAAALGRSAKTDGVLKFVLVFGDAAIVKRELLAILDRLDRVHRDHVLSTNSHDHSCTVRIARVRKPRCKVALQNRIDKQHTVAARIIAMSFEHDIVKIGQDRLETQLLLRILDCVLLFVPPPRREDLTEIFNDKASWLNTILAQTADTQSFGKQAKIRHAVHIDGSLKRTRSPLDAHQSRCEGSCGINARINPGSISFCSRRGEMPHKVQDTDLGRGIFFVRFRLPKSARHADMIDDAAKRRSCAW